MRMIELEGKEGTGEIFITDDEWLDNDVDQTLFNFSHSEFFELSPSSPYF